MSWLPVSFADVLAYSRSERLTKAWDADDTTQRDAWFEIQRAGVVADIRRKCGSSGRYALDSDTANVPPEFHDLAVLRLLVKILGRIGPTAGAGGDNGADPLALTQDQRDEKRRLEKDLDAVAAGTLGLSIPDAEETEASHTSASLGSPSIAAPARTAFTFDEQDGL